MNQALEPSPPQRGRLIRYARACLGCAILSLLVTIVYWPTLAAGFGSSSDYIEHNPAIRTLPGLADIWFKFNATNQYMPVVFSTFWVEYHLWELDPRGYHVVNLLLHATSAVLVWWLLARLGVPGAWLAAAIFAVHPIEVDAIAVLHQRKKVLTCIFALASLLAYLRFSPPESPDVTIGEVPRTRGRWGYYVLAFLLYLASLLGSAETAFGPAVLLVIYWWKRGRLTWRDVAQTAPFFVVGWALYSVTVWREMALIVDSGQSWNFSLLERVLLAGRIFWFYAGKLAWPYPLMVIYPQWVIDSRLWWQYLFPAAFLAVLVGLWLARKRIGRGPLAGVLIFAGMLAPGLGFFDFFAFQITFVGDHFQYHASIALIALAAATAVTLAGHLPTSARWLAAVAGAALLLPLAVVSHERTHVYKNEATMMEDFRAKAAPSWQKLCYIGSLLQQEGKYAEALAHVRQAIDLQEQLVRDNPTRSIYKHDLALLHVGISLIQRDAGQMAEREISLRNAIDIQEKLFHDNSSLRKYQDDLAKSYAQLARAQREAGRPADAAVLLHKAIAVRQNLARDNPTVSKVQNNLAMSYADLGILQRDMGPPNEAASAFRRAIDVREKLIRDDPLVAEYQAVLAASYEDLAIAQRNVGRATEAVASRRKAIEIRETLARHTGELTVLRLVDQIETRQHLVDNGLLMSEYQNDLAASYTDLGLLEREVGRPAATESAFRKALEIREKVSRDNPNSSKYKNDLAASYVDFGILQYNMGRMAEAETSFRKAIEIREKLAQEHPLVRDYRSGLAWCYVDLAGTQHSSGRSAEAEASYRKAIQLREKLAEDDPGVEHFQHELAASYRDLSHLLRATSRLDEAETACRKAITIRQKLVEDDPTNAACRSNLASDLALCGDTLALLGRWSEGADLYVQAVGAGDDSWQTMGALALVQLAAGNESTYRATCAVLVQRYAGNVPQDGVVLFALAMVVGDNALSDMNQALVLANRAAEADPSNPLATIVVGAAQYRAGSSANAIATLTMELSRLDPAAPPAATTDQILVGRLVGAMILALAYREQSDRESLQKQLEILQTSIDRTGLTPQSSAGLPAWAVRFAVEIANRELAKLSATANAPVPGT